MARKFVMSINEEDNTIANMAKTLGVQKAEVVMLSLNLMHYVLEQRRQNKFVSVGPDRPDKTKDIIEEATGGAIAFTIQPVNANG